MAPDSPLDVQVIHVLAKHVSVSKFLDMCNLVHNNSEDKRLRFAWRDVEWRGDVVCFGQHFHPHLEETLGEHGEGGSALFSSFSFLGMHVRMIIIPLNAKLFF